jgi:hypothetical protein
MASPSIRRIERLNYVLAVVTVLVGVFTQDQRVILGLMVGSALTCLNFLLLRKLVVKWTTEAATGKPGNASLLMLPKMIFLMGAVAVSVLLLPLNVIAFAIGYSIFIASIVIEATYSALRPQPAPSSDSSEHSNG